MSEDFMYADLSRMLELPKCAVLMRTEEEARAFFHNSIQQIAEQVHCGTAVHCATEDEAKLSFENLAGYMNM